MTTLMDTGQLRSNVGHEPKRLGVTRQDRPKREQENIITKLQVV